MWHYAPGVRRQTHTAAIGIHPIYGPGGPARKDYKPEGENPK